MPYREQIAHLQAPPDIEISIEKSVETPFFEWGNWPEICWWQVFDDPQLDTLIQEALADNPTLQEVVSRVELARAESIITHLTQRYRGIDWLRGQSASESSSPDFSKSLSSLVFASYPLASSLCLGLFA